MSKLVRIALAGWLIACGTDPSTTSTSGGGGTSQGGMGGDGAANTGGANVDHMPPGPPTELSITLESAPFGASLSWTPPADDDVAGYLVVRGASAADLAAVMPSDGTSYTPVNTFGSSVVAYAGEANATLDAAVPLERESHYSVWAYDRGGLYGPPITGSLVVPFPQQLATLRIDDPTGSPTVTVVSQPSHTLLNASAALETTQLVVTLSVANSSHRAWFNPKVIVNQLSDVVATATADGTMATGRVMDYLGPTPLGVGTFRNSTLRFNGVVTDPLLVDISIEGSPAMITGHQAYYRSICVYDLSGARDAQGRSFGGTITINNVTKPYPDQFGGGFQLRGGFLSPDGRHLVMARAREAPWFETIDLTTAETTPSTPLAAQGYLSMPVGSADGAHIYAALYEGERARRPGHPPGTGNISLVRVDRQTLEETGRALLVTAGQHLGTNEIALSPDQTRIAVPLRIMQQLALVDTASMTAIDTDPGTAGTQHVSVGFDFNSPIFSADSSEVIVAASTPSGPNSVVTVDMTSFAISPVSIPPAGGWVSEVALGPDGRVWLGRMTGAGSVVDTSNDTAVNFGATLYTRAIVFHENAAWLNDANNMSLRRYNTQTLAEYDSDGDTSNGITPLDYSGFYCWAAHGAIVTPF